MRAAQAAVLVGAIAASGDARGQTIYVANQFTQPFVPLGSGATVVLDPLQNWNDQAVIIPIGFTFTYYGVAYDFIEVADNGYVAFKPMCSEGCDFDEFCDFATNACFRGWASGGDWEGLPSTTTPNRVVAPFWDDLILDTTAPASVVQTRLLGAAPNRELVIEWRNMRHVNFSRQPIARATFQLRLREGSNNVRFAYGAFTQGPDNADWSGRVGIEDPFGVDGVTPLTCSQNQGMCDWSALAGLQNQVIEIGIPNVPELTGDVDPLLGAQPGDQVTLSARVRNVGLQPTTTPIEVAFYLSTDGILTPAIDTLLGTATVGIIDAAGGAVATTTVTMPTVPTGYYTLGAIFDSSGVVTEATENNNTSISPEAFLVGSDLEAFFSTQPLPQPPGRTGEVSFDVTNRSSAADHIMWRVVLSADTSIDPSDAIIAEGTSSFGASQVTTVTTPTTIPGTVFPGYYTLIVEVDTLGVLSEADELNNVAYGFAIVGPDAYPTGITAPPRSGAGATLPVTLSIENQGSVVDAIDYQLYLSTDPSFEPTDLLLGSGTTSLDASHETLVELVTTVPEGLAAGTYYFIGVVDPADVVLELDEINNITVLGTIDFVGPDLAIESVDGRSLLFRGLPYTIDASMTNQGGEPVRNVYVSFHLSVNQLITTSDPMLVELGPYSLQPGESVQIAHTLTIPTTTTRGLYWLGAIGDARSSIPNDSHLQNNIRRGSAQVLVRDPAPDFVITELAIPTDAGAGEVFPAQRTLENQGNATGTVGYEIYLVSQSTATRFALVGRGTATLDPGQLEVGVDTLTVPASIPAGTYRIEYDIDPENTVDEIVDDNNVAVSDGSVAIDASGLSITTTSLPFGTVGLAYDAKLDARGGTAAVTWSVASGALPAGLTLDTGTGRITGTPTAEGRASFVARVTDGALVDERSLSLLVADSTVDLRIVTRALPPVWAGVDYEHPLTALGGVPPYAWRVSPQLPIGLTITSSGAVAGKTSTTAPSNVYTFTVTDALGESVSLPMALRVLARDRALRFDMGALSDGIVGSTYDATLRATNGVGPYTFSLASGELPPGLSIENEHLTGVPVRQGTYAFQVRVEDSVGDLDVEYFVVTIESSDGITFVTKGLPFAALGAEYVDPNDRPVLVKAISTGTSTSITYALAGGTLPAGISLDADGLLHGTPTAVGVSAFTVIATNDLGETDVRAFGLSVVDLTPDPLTPTSGDDGCGCTTTEPSSSRGLGLFFVVAGLLVLRLRRRGLGALASLFVALGVAAPSTASAQRGDAGVPPGLDAGSGGGGTAQYFTSTRTEAYVERSGGTALRFRSNDDDWQPYTLPFAFRFYENDYSEIRVSTNGYISFTDDAYSYSNDVIPNFNPPNNTIFLVWDDLWTTDVTVHEEGTAPNRVVIVQWRNSAHLGDQGRTFNLQLWLFEGPAARFELWYGPQNGVAQGSSFTASGGYEDSSGSRGEALLACSPNCSNADIGALPDTVFEVLQDAGEDLNAARVEIPDSRVPLRKYQGVPFDVISTINSYHGSPIGPFSYSLFLLAPGETAPSAPPFFTSAPVTLAPYQSLSATDSVTIPITTPEGRYRLALVVDGNNDVAEPDENNNLVLGGQELIIGERQPDLRVADVQVTGTGAAPGSTMPVSVTLENFGNLDTTASWKLVLSPNSAPSTEDLVLHTSSPIALGAASTETVTLDVTLPATVRPGRYYVGVVMDPENVIREISEVNNTGRTLSAVFVGSADVELLTAQLPAAYVGVEYDVRLESAGGDGQYVYELLGGTLPAGLAFTPGTGRIAGKPTAIADASLTFRVTSNGQSDTATLSLEVLPADGPLTIVTRRLLPGTVGVPYPPSEDGQDPSTLQRIVTVGGDTSNVTFSITAGQAPTGLVLDPDGYLHGVPTGRGTYSLTVEATDGVETTTRELSITIVEPGRLSILAGPLPDATLGQPYAFAFYVTGRQADVPLTYALVAGSGALPEGLTLANDGELQGTPGHAGVYTFAVEVSEPGTLGARDSAWFRLVVDAPATLGIFPSALPDAVVGVPYQVTMEARQGTAPYAWTVVVNGELPRGLSWSMIEESGEAKIRIAGTPEEIPGVATQNTDTGGVVALLLTLKDGEGRAIEQSYALRVVAPPKPPKPADSGGCVCVTGSTRVDGAFGLLALLGLALFVRSRREDAR
ncbi:putative Ig domain-containing protein [Myxococcota bacterium]|nr:putative Ig domain-containing protein [Myxococcota bacterium]